MRICFHILYSAILAIKERAGLRNPIGCTMNSSLNGQTTNGVKAKEQLICKWSYKSLGVYQGVFLFLFSRHKGRLHFPDSLTGRSRSCDRFLANKMREGGCTPLPG